MKNYTKKIIVGIFALVFLFGGSQSLFASSQWNGDSKDCKSLSIVNATTSEGYVNPCWPLSSVSADAGNTVNVRIYYHNTGTTTANNTRLVLNAPMDSSSATKSFSGSISSDQGGLSLGSVTANLSSSQSITLNSVKWYPNNAANAATLPYGQSGSEILSGGLNIGSIASGWPTQGSVVVSFYIGNSVTPSQNQICQDSSATNYLGALPCTYPVASVCTISSFTANNNSSSASINNGDLVTLRWNTNNCDHVNITTLGSVNSDDSENVYPNSDTTYVLTAYNTGGVSKTKSVRVYVSNDYSSNYNNYTNNTNCSISNFTPSSTYVNSGSPVTLNWNTSNCSNVTISNLNYNVPVSGSQNIWPSYTTTYTLTAYDSNGGIQTRSATVLVNNITNQNYCSISSFTPSSTYVNSGSPVTLNWNTSNCSNVNISNVGYVSSYGSTTVYPSNTTNYILTADGNTRTIQINVNNYVAPVVVYNSNVVTTVATNISTNSTTLNGYITNSNYYNSNTYFEYGTSVDLGLRTSAKTTNGNSTFNDYISGLAPNTIYYFRAVSDGSNGTSLGDIEVFKTLGAGSTVQRVVIQGTTVTGTSSPIMLKIEDRYQSIGVGDTVDYTVSYKNISKNTLTNSVLQVVLPSDIEFTNSSAGTYSTDTNTLTLELKDLVPGEDGVVYVQGKVKSLPANSAQIVTTAILVYTNSNSAQENAMAYVLNNPKDNNSSLGAAAIFSGLANIGLIGWLFIIVLILLLVLVARSLTHKPAQATANITH